MAFRYVYIYITYLFNILLFYYFNRITFEIEILKLFYIVNEIENTRTDTV